MSPNRNTEHTTTNYWTKLEDCVNLLDGEIGPKETRLCKGCGLDIEKGIPDIGIGSGL